jgi:hypothetical protein
VQFEAAAVAAGPLAAAPPRLRTAAAQATVMRDTILMAGTVGTFRTAGKLPGGRAGDRRWQRGHRAGPAA